MSGTARKESEKITVLITAFNRRQFLKAAVVSVLNQTLSRDFYEIIVTKNFIDAEIDKFLLENDVIMILDRSQNVGAMLSNCIKKASNSIICFLDDDDLFYENKLEVVLNEFLKSDNLGYFRNGISYIDENGIQISNSEQFKPSFFVNTQKTPLTVETTSHLLKMQADFNMSSISIRKKWVLEYLSYLELLTLAQDSFFFFLALEHAQVLEINQQSLTRYRVHNSISRVSGDFSSFYQKIIFLYENFEIAWDLILKLSKNDVVRIFVAYHKEEAQLYKALGSHETRNLRLMKTSISYFYYFKYVRTASFLFQSLLFIMFQFLPFFAMRFYFFLKKFPS